MINKASLPGSPFCSLRAGRGAAGSQVCFARRSPNSVGTCPFCEILVNTCGGILELRRGSQPSPWVGPGKPNLPLGLRGLKSLLQHHSSKASILWCSAFFTVELSHPYKTTGKTIALLGWSLTISMKLQKGPPPRPQPPTNNYVSLCAPLPQTDTPGAQVTVCLHLSGDPQTRVE